MTNISLGILDLVPQPTGMAAEQAVQAAVRLARSAEAWGYARYWAAEHHDLEGLACAAPEVLLAHVGAVTRTIKLGTGALLLPHYSPLKVAETFRLLSALMPGRIELGLGRAPGGPAHASMALSGNFLQRVSSMESSLESLVALLEDRYTYEDYLVQARPFSKDTPELWLLGTHTKSAGFAAKLGMSFVFGGFMSDDDPAAVLDSYRAAYVPRREGLEPHAQMAVTVFCAHSRAEAERMAESTAWRQNQERSTSGESSYKAESELIGSPSEVAERLQHLSEKYNNNDFLIFNPVTDLAWRLESYQLLAEQFRPASR